MSERNVFVKNKILNSSEKRDLKGPQKNPVMKKEGNKSDISNKKKALDQNGRNKQTNRNTEKVPNKQPKQ